MKAYRIIAYQSNLRVDQVVKADDVKGALNKFSEMVDQGKCEIVSDGFSGNTEVHITYEELKDESKEDRVVEKTSTP